MRWFAFAACVAEYLQVCRTRWTRTPLSCRGLFVIVFRVSFAARLCCASEPPHDDAFDRNDPYACVFFLLWGHCREQCSLEYYPVLSCPVLLCPVLSRPVLQSSVLSCPVLACPTLPCPALSRLAISCLVLSCPGMPCPTLSCPGLSCPFLSCPMGCAGCV